MDKLNALIAATTVAAMIAGISVAHGFVLTNQDTTNYQVWITEDIDPETTHELELDQGDFVDDLCKEGCLVKINGQDYKFFGDEEVTIRDGELDIVPTE